MIRALPLKHATMICSYFAMAEKSEFPERIGLDNGRYWELERSGNFIRYECFVSDGEVFCAELIPKVWKALGKKPKPLKQTELYVSFRIFGEKDETMEPGYEEGIVIVDGELKNKYRMYRDSPAGGFHNMLLGEPMAPYEREYNTTPYLEQKGSIEALQKLPDPFQEQLSPVLVATGKPGLEEIAFKRLTIDQILLFNADEFCVRAGYKHVNDILRDMQTGKISEEEGERLLNILYGS